MNKESKFTLAHYRDVKSHNWNRTCPQCGKREFSPYIDLYTGRPIDDKHCGKCNNYIFISHDQTPITFRFQMIHKILINLIDYIIKSKKKTGETILESVDLVL